MPVSGEMWEHVRVGFSFHCHPLAKCALGSVSNYKYGEAWSPFLVFHHFCVFHQHSQQTMVWSLSTFNTSDSIIIALCSSMLRMLMNGKELGKTISC